MLAKFKYRPWLTVITVFFNMKREAPRTLLSLSRGYQRLAADIRYEVVALDHGSMEPIDPPHTLGPGVKFTYRHIATTSCSPVTAINEAALQANGDFLMVHIDGARILSPGVLEATWRATKAFEQPFIYTLGWHLGPAVQNLSITQGYDQSKEDKLLEDIDWIHDGYRLFEASTLAMSSAGGFLNPIAESNCFTLSRRIWEDLGGFDPGFQSPVGAWQTSISLTGPAMQPVLRRCACWAKEPFIRYMVGWQPTSRWRNTRCRASLMSTGNSVGTIGRSPMTCSPHFSATSPLALNAL